VVSPFSTTVTFLGPLPSMSSVTFLLEALILQLIAEGSPRRSADRPWSRIAMMAGAALFEYISQHRRPNDLAARLISCGSEPASLDGRATT